VVVVCASSHCAARLHTRGRDTHMHTPPTLAFWKDWMLDIVVHKRRSSREARMKNEGSVQNLRIGRLLIEMGR
jgi:hypothetical protein